ncbi:MAG: YlxM family DNA-binding protein [Lachnospirales bacterium]
MEESVKLTIIYDLYSPLLTDKQREVFDYYYMNDYSLSEIAELCKVSKASVFDLINRTKAKLYDFEVKLKLFEKHMAKQNIYEDIQKNLDKLKSRDKNIDLFEKSIEALKNLDL